MQERRVEARQDEALAEPDETPQQELRRFDA
jgi:hypothetical protein